MEVFMHRNNLSSSDLRTVFYEKLDALLDECDQVIDNAEFGQTFHDLDDFFCTKGHTFLQEVFQEKLQKRIEHVQTNNEAKQCGECKKKIIITTPSKKT
jgi:NH3-dependent NAD+ synthetase